MKKNTLPIAFFLFLLLIFVYSVQNSFYFWNKNAISSQYSTNVRITPLRDKEFSPLRNPRTGVNPDSDISRTTRASIQGDFGTVFPGDRIQNASHYRFAFPGQTTYAVVGQVIQIFLNKDDYGTPTDPNHWLTNLTTNGMPPDEDWENPAISSNPAYGYIDLDIVIPSDISTLNTQYGIQPGDTVSILQYYSGNNATGKIDVDPFNNTDSFTLSGFSTIAAQGTGFVNPASGDSTFRQDESAVVTLEATSEGSPVPGVNFSTELRFKTNDTVIPNGINGMTYYFYDVLSGNPNTTSDGNGEIGLNISTSSSSSEVDYYFFIRGNFTGTGQFTTNFDGSDPATNYFDMTANFTILNEMDFVYLDYVSATNQPLDPPNFNITIVTFQVRAQYAYGGTYYPANIPVNATFAIPPTGGVTLSIAVGYSNNGSTDWALTDSNGYVAFNITAEFPILYLDVLQDINVFSDVRSNSPPIYPPTSLPNNQPHRFMRNDPSGFIVNQSQTISIDPDFWVGEIIFSNSNVSVIKPGETAFLEFEVHSVDNPGTKFSGVPVNISLNSPISGVSLIPNGIRNTPFGSNYYRTDSNGIIEILVKTTYLVTPEIQQYIILDFIIDFENDSQVRWIGDTNAGTGSLAQFSKSWLTDQDTTNLQIDPGFLVSEIVYDTTNESGDANIRSGDTLEVTFKVQTVIGGTALPNVPVNVSFVGTYPGVSMVNIVGIFDRQQYYRTDASGLVTVRIITTYPTTPKSLPVILNATADFENASLPSKWYVGEKIIYPNFGSNASYSDVEKTINILPQYFFGEIFVPGGNNPNATRVGQTESIEIEFALRLSYSGGGTVSPSINNVNVSIEINGTTPSTWKMDILPLEYQDASSSSAIFVIQTNVSGATPQGYYNVTAIAHFDDAKGLTYNLTHATVPSGKLPGRWVNGSEPDGKSYTSYMIRVKNIDSIKIFIPTGEITDPSHNDAGLNPVTGKYEVYRDSSTINISGTYKDITQQPVPNDTEVTISYNSSLGSIFLGTTQTRADGTFSTLITLPGTAPIEDISSIYGWDASDPDPAEDREGISNIRVVTAINLSDYRRSGIYNGISVYVGETVSVSGTIRD
ncbi:MAG: hypothetical protein ACXACK_02235, partial [Candidatus Hodarchaeales archaeon]